MKRFAVFGLGNPGAEFVSTRHNVGFECVDLLLQRLLFKQHPTETLFGNTASKCKYSEVAIESHNKLLYLVQPQTFMNRSGSGVRGFMEQFQIPRKNILVISDDISLPLGRIRVRRSGSSGGQNGLESIIRQFGSDEFDRLKIGIGPTSGRPPFDTARFVLAKFNAEERELLTKVLAMAVDCLNTWILEGTPRAANQFNGKTIESP